MDLLFGENGKTKHLWPPWVLEFFMGLLQFVPVELECGFSQWRFGDVACEFVCCTNVSCASRKMFCSILVLVSLPQPYGKHVSLSTVSKKAVLDYFHKHVFCGFSFATPFTSRCHTMGLFCCTTLLVLERECELATDWDFPWGFMVSYSTGTTACNRSTSHAISRESKLFVLPMDPLSGDFMSEYGVVLRPKSGHKHKIKTNARDKIFSLCVNNNTISIRGRIFRTRRDLMQRHHAWTARNPMRSTEIDFFLLRVDLQMIETLHVAVRCHNDLETNMGIFMT
ncbi:hypothetical protein YC2023_051415 [Brassica napus]